MIAEDHDARLAAAHSHADDWMSAAEHLAAWDAGREQASRYVSTDTRYVHWTDEEGAEAIAGGQPPRLWGCSYIVDTVFAQPVGGAFVPQVQTGETSGNGFGRVRGARTRAVVFTAPTIPDGINPTEVFWKRTGAMAIADVEVIDAEHARALMDDSLGVPE